MVNMPVVIPMVASIAPSRKCDGTNQTIVQSSMVCIDMTSYLGVFPFLRFL